MRGKGEGSIYKRKDGYWVGSVEAGRGPTGKRKRVRIVRRYRADVVNEINNLRQQVADGGVPDRSKTVKQYLEWWLAEVAPSGGASDDSLNEYRKRVNRVTPSIGHVRLHKLGVPHVQALAAQLGASHAHRTARYTLSTLSTALRWAAGAKLIASNPVEFATVPEAGPAKVDDALSTAEAKAVLATIGGGELEALWWLALNYGLRQGEILGLRWGDVDFEAEQVHVRRSKTGAGVRTLPLIPQAARQLRQHRQRASVVELSGHVFLAPSGKPMRQRPVRDQWHDLLRSVGVAHMCGRCGTDKECYGTVRRFHISRHTAATLLLEAGVPLEVVSSILGHANIGITSGTYAKVRADLQRRGLMALGDGDATGHQPG